MRQAWARKGAGLYVELLSYARENSGGRSQCWQERDREEVEGGCWRGRERGAKRRNGLGAGGKRHEQRSGKRSEMEWNHKGQMNQRETCWRGKDLKRTRDKDRRNDKSHEGWPEKAKQRLQPCRPRARASCSSPGHDQLPVCWTQVHSLPQTGWLSQGILSPVSGVLGGRRVGRRRVGGKRGRTPALQASAGWWVWAAWP